MQRVSALNSGIHSVAPPAGPAHAIHSSTPRPKSPDSLSHGDTERTEDKLCVLRASVAEKLLADLRRPVLATFDLHADRYFAIRLQQRALDEGQVGDRIEIVLAQRALQLGARHRLALQVVDQNAAILDQ